jgi:hypothetical protein
VLLFMLLLLGHGVLVGNPLLHAQSGNSTGLPDKVGVKITFPHANSTIPVGTLAVNGTSSDTSQTDCRVYIDWNDLKPMQNVTASGINGTNDYSNWTFTYDQNYHVIAEGINELTSKIVCINNPSGNMTTKFYSINVTGIMNNSSSTSPSVTAALNQTDSNSNGYHTVSYQGILPQYNGATIEEADESIVKDKDSGDKENAEPEDSPEVDGSSSSTDDPVDEDIDDDNTSDDTKEDSEIVESFKDIYPDALTVSYNDVNENVESNEGHTKDTKLSNVKHSFDTDDDDKKDKDTKTIKVEKIQKKKVQKSIFGKMNLMDSSELEKSIKSSIKKKLNKVVHNLLN